MLRFACVGAFSTLLHLLLFGVFLSAYPYSQVANTAALVIATVANTAANRRWTFGITGRSAATRQHLQALLVFGLTWTTSAVALWALHALSSSPHAMLQAIVVGASMGVSTVVRYLAMRVWIFTPAH
jgi:putative flippase GtrA